MNSRIAAITRWLHMNSPTVGSHDGARERAILVLHNLLDDRPRGWVAKRIHLENSKMLSPSRRKTDGAT